MIPKKYMILLIKLINGIDIYIYYWSYTIVLIHALKKFVVTNI